MGNNVEVDRPLTSNDQAKVLVFALLLVPSVVFGVGIIPSILLIFGVHMMKRNHDFSHIDVAVKNFRRYTLFVMVGAVIWSVLWLLQERNSEWFAPLILFFLPCLAYYMVIVPLFYQPLKSRYLWIEQNGIFSSEKTKIQRVSSQPELDIIKGDRLKQYSVADELLKWVKLKEDGHISETEFNEARAKLLKKD